MPIQTASPDRKTVIRAELLRRAKAGQTISYGEAAKMVGLAAQGLGKILDEIGAEEASENRPDLACLVVNARTGFPGYIGAGEDERRNALAVREAVFKVHGFAP